MHQIISNNYFLLFLNQGLDCTYVNNSSLQRTSLLSPFWNVVVETCRLCSSSLLVAGEGSSLLSSLFFVPSVGSMNFSMFCNLSELTNLISSANCLLFSIIFCFKSLFNLFLYTNIKLIFQHFFFFNYCKQK